MSAEERILFDEVKAALAAEQREHDITRRQRDTLQTQCEDMQSEIYTETTQNNAAMKPSVGVDNQAIVDIVVEKDDKISILMQRVAHADERLETANAMATTYADANASLKRELATTTQRLDNSLNITDEIVSTDMKDEMACMAEEAIGLKADIANLQGAVESAKGLQDSYKRTGLTLSDDNFKLRQKIEALELVDVALRTEVSKLAGYKVELESSAETQATHMQQVDAACKAAEAKVIEQRKEIEALNADEELWICPNVDECSSQCYHSIAHKHDFTCVTIAGGGLPCTDCVKVNPCKECATLRDEIINRDAVILEQESRAEDREEIINTLAKKIKVMSCVEVTAPTTGTYTIMFSGKAGDMQTPTAKSACKWYNVCTIASDTAYACTANGGQHCGRKREIDAKHGVMP